MNQPGEIYVDSHIHLWELERFDYSDFPTKEMPRIMRNFTPEDLKEAIEPTPVRNVISVQVINNSENETRHVQELAKEFTFIKGIVGWVDLTDKNVEANLAHIAKDKRIVGIRDILDYHDDEWLLREDVIRGCQAVANQDLVLDLTLRPKTLKPAIKFKRKLPNLKVVVDHIAKPLIKDGVIDGWKEDIAQLAKMPNIYCKLSGMVTEADHKNWTIDQLQPYIQHVLSVFGPERCMYGSDWPVCLLAVNSYSEWFRTLEKCLENLPDEQRMPIFGANAARIYGLRV